MSDSDNDKNMSEEEEEQIASDQSSMSEENDNNEPDFKKELIIHKVPSTLLRNLMICDVPLTYLTMRITLWVHLKNI
jgi:hypothetical protein